MPSTALSHIVIALALGLAVAATARAEIPPYTIPDPPEISQSAPTAPDTGTSPVASPVTQGAERAQDAAPVEVPVAQPREGGRETAGWRWRRVGWEHYTGIAILGAGAIYVESEYGRPDPKWKRHIGFDEEVRDVLRLSSRDARDVAHTVDDVLMWGMIFAPVIDTFATLGLRDGDWDTHWQTQMVNLESYAFTSFVSAALQNLIAREKPFVRNCVNGDCEGEAINRSMPSGHAAFAFTGAGLVCNHHKYQSLYGDPTYDRAACATGIVLASADGLVRIMADHHYATDVIAGTAIGLFSGFVLPRLLHYSRPVARPAAKRQGAPSLTDRISVLPFASDHATGLSLALRF